MLVLIFKLRISSCLENAFEFLFGRGKGARISHNKEREKEELDRLYWSINIIMLNDNAEQCVSTLMIMIYTIGYGNVADIYVELNNQLAIHDVLELCCTSFDM